MTGQTCSKCHAEHDPEKCQGHVIKDPQTRELMAPRQCGKQPMKGQRVCRSHGGSTAKSRGAAETRQAEDQASKVIAGIWPGLSKAEPVKDPIELLARVAGVLEQMTDKVGARVNELDGKVATGKDLAQLRAEVVLLEKLLGHLRAVGTDMARLGLAERQIELQQGQADLVIGAIAAAMDSLTLTPADRDILLRAFLVGIGRGPAVAGEVMA